MDLVEIPENPAPPNGEVLQVIARDGVVLRAAYWQATVPEPRGTVCILQGRAEFIEKYFETIGELLARGFAVAAFDWRGQGGSDRALRDARKGYVRRFKHYRRDLEAVQQQLLPLLPAPYFALAHSMGGAIALDAFRHGLTPFERLVTTAPMLGLSLIRRVRLSRIAARLLTWCGFGRAYVPGGGATSMFTKPFEGNPLTGDRRRYARNAALASALGERVIGDPTITWVDGAFGLMESLAEPHAPLEIRVPTLILVAGADAVCLNRAMDAFAARLKGGHALTLPGARHEVLMESDAIRDLAWAAFDAFVPGTRSPSEATGTAESGAREKAQGRLVEAAVAGGHDGAAA